MLPFKINLKQTNGCGKLLFYKIFLNRLKLEKKNFENRTK